MRMHTIPQNVTAYEDRIVGMLIGRQFIYLAIAGVTIFILMSSQSIPVVIRLFFSILIGSFAAALALYRPDDRGFDQLFMSYVRAMFGPTEWVWRKDVLPMVKLQAAITEFRAPTVTKSRSADRAERISQNLERLSQFQTFLTEREIREIDEDELRFLESLNFAEPIPNKALATATPSKPAPPMLTKSNYTQARATIERPKPQPLNLPKPTPVSPLAGSTNPLNATITFNGSLHSIALRRNSRTNRSLSRQLLSNGSMTIPIRGEAQFEVTPGLQQELTSIKTVAPEKATETAVDLTGQPTQQNTTPAASTPQPAGQAASVPQPTSPPKHTNNPASAYDIFFTNSKSQHHRPLSQPSADSGITNTTKGASMADNQNQPLNTPGASDQQNQPASPLHQPDSLMPSQSDQPPANQGSPDLTEQLQQAESKIKQQISEVETANHPNQSTSEDEVSEQPSADPAASAPLTDTAPATDELLLDHYKDEIARLTAYNQQIEARAKQAEDALAAMQQTADSPNQQNVASQQELVQKLRTEQQQTAAFTQELQQKVGDPSALRTPHLHIDYAPVPDVPPVIGAAEPAEQIPVSPPETNSAQPNVSAAHTPAPTPPSTENASGEQTEDLQSRLSAAGVGASDPLHPASNAAVVDNSSSIALTNQPNIISGRVVDGQGKSLPGVIVVVKNAHGEPKRALKTNKLGQFVVTTPLANGQYSVEVDKKGLSFDIMSVELTGAVAPPLVIAAK